jgi:hybrid cluster-associated redox disulfide protein
MTDKPPSQKITADMSIEDVVAEYPEAAKVFFRHGMQCTGCYICGFHNIADGAEQWGVELEPLLTDLNGVVTTY